MKQGRTEADIHKVISRARDAHQDYALVEEKIEYFKKTCRVAYENTKPLQDIERRNLWQALHIADKVLEYLTQDINEGKIAIQTLEEIKKVGKPTLLDKYIP